MIATAWMLADRLDPRNRSWLGATLSGARLRAFRHNGQRRAGGHCLQQQRREDPQRRLLVSQKACQHGRGTKS